MPTAWVLIQSSLSDFIRCHHHGMARRMYCWWSAFCVLITFHTVTEFTFGYLLCDVERVDNCIALSHYQVHRKSVPAEFQTTIHAHIHTVYICLFKCVQQNIEWSEVVYFYMMSWWYCTVEAAEFRDFDLRFICTSLYCVDAVTI